MRYPIADLFALMPGSDNDCRRQLAISGAAYGNMVQHGLTFDQAERYAERAGLNIYVVWPAAVDELIERESKVCAAPACDERFVPTHPRRIYCSQRCQQNVAKAAWKRRRYQSDPEFRERLKAESVARYWRDRDYIRRQQNERRRSMA